MSQVTNRGASHPFSLGIASSPSVQPFADQDFSLKIGIPEIKIPEIKIPEIKIPGRKLENPP